LLNTLFRLLGTLLFPCRALLGLFHASRQLNRAQEGPTVGIEDRQAVFVKPEAESRPAPSVR